MSVTIYTIPACIQCKLSINELVVAGVEHTVIDISKDSSARDYIISLGYLQAPVVVAGAMHWSGFRVERLRALAVAANQRPLAKPFVQEDGKPET
jgi:glutaredoxin-like protein NrdH